MLASALVLAVPAIAEAKKRVAILTLRMGASVIQEIRSAAVERFAQLGFTQDANLELRVFNAELRELREKAVRDAMAWRADLIMCFGTNAARIAIKLTTLPVVFLNVSEPVRAGLATTLNRPGGRSTGTSGRSVDLMGKRLELLCELAPGNKRVAVLTAMGSAPTAIEELTRASRKFGVSIIEIRLHDDADYEFVRSSLASSRAQAVLVVGWIRLDEFEEQALEYFKKARLPSAWSDVRQVERGGLVSVGIAGDEMLVHGVEIAVRILLGEAPGFIPVHQVTRVQTALNLATARELGLQVPAHVVLSADRIVK